MPLPADFNEKAALIQQGALAYAASVRQPGQLAEDLLAEVSAWIGARSDAERTLQVVHIQSQALETVVYDPTTGASVSSDATDVFIFVVQTTYTDGTTATTSVAIPRSSLEA